MSSARQTVGLRFAWPTLIALAAIPLARAGDTIFVPLRWTAIRGTPAVDNPGGVGEPDTDNVLWRRHERATDRTWIPGANISFRSAVIRDVLNNSNFPLIDDPHPPSAGGPGQLGDILDPDIDDTELNDALAAARTAWAQSFPAARGPVVVNLRRFVDSNGNAISLRGIGSSSFSFPAGTTRATVCMTPSVITAVNDSQAFVVVTDNSFLMSDTDDVILAHELGHFMHLGHGNGLDDDMDGLFDGFCDDTENRTATPNTVMTAGQITVRTVTALQRGTARAFALETPGAEVDPPGVFIPVDTLSATGIDPVHDVQASSADLTDLSLALNLTQGLLTVSHGVFDTLPFSAVSHRFLAFLDLDGNPATGGAPSTLGLPTGFQGAELVTQVTVAFVGEFLTVTPAAWTFAGGTFMPLPGRDLDARLRRNVEHEQGTELSDALELQLSADLVGGIPALVGHPMRVQATAEATFTIRGVQTGQITILDRMPAVVEDSARTLELTAPRYPLALFSPALLFPGSLFHLDVTGLFPDRMVKIFLGDVMIATGITDAEGAIAIDLTLPADTETGERLLTIGNVGTALTADTVVDVRPLTEAAAPACTTDRSVQLWPPNHDYHAIDVRAAAGVTDPNGLPFTLQVTSITQDEPVTGQGTGNTTCDGTGIGTGIARLRAERAGGGDGRVYHVHYMATNSAGLACNGLLRVTVPHSQNGAPAVDGGELFDSNAGCP